MKMIYLFINITLLWWSNVKGMEGIGLDLQGLEERFRNASRFEQKWVKRVGMNILNPNLHYDYKRGFVSGEKEERKGESVSRSKMEAYSKIFKESGYDDKTIADMMLNLENVNPYMLGT